MKRRHAMGYVLVLLLLYLASRSVTMADSPTAEQGVLLLSHGTDTAISVRFDHRLHDSYVACSLCHHHLTGTPPAEAGCRKCHKHGIDGTEVACRSCHLAQPFTSARRQMLQRDNPYHIDIVGLIGAYHLLCIDCHETVGTGPTGCTDCHATTRGTPVKAKYRGELHDTGRSEEDQ